MIYILQPPPPPHSASCNVCLFVCVHISKCTSAPRKNTTMVVAECLCRVVVYFPCMSVACDGVMYICIYVYIIRI